MVDRLEHESTGPTEQTRRARLTNEQIGNLISAAGNHEAKAITLLVMRNGNIFSSWNLRKAVLYAQGEEIGWSMADGTLLAYCAASLNPIGLVTKEVLNPDLSTYGYQITDYGRNIGVPFCGLKLDWSERHNIALNSLWGQTNSSSTTKQIANPTTGEMLEFKKRAPVATLDILYELTTAPKLPIRMIDLANRLEGNFAPNLFHHLSRLATAGLIDYQSIEANKPVSAYKLTSPSPAGELPAFQRYVLLTPIIHSILQTYPDSYLTIEDISDLLPQKMKNRWLNSSLNSIVWQILSHLKRNNYIEIQHFHQGFHSEINLNDKQRTILTELMETIDRFQDQDSKLIDKGRELAEEIINNPTRVSNLLKRAKEQSSIVNRTPFQKVMDHLSNLITSHPGATNRDLQQLLQQGDIKLGINRVQRLTAILEATNSVLVKKVGSVKGFFPLDEQS